MKKTFTSYLLALVSLVLMGTNVVQATTTTPIAQNYTFIPANEITAAVKDYTTADGYIKILDSGYSTSKGESTIDGNTYKNVLQIKNKARVLIFSVAAKCTVTIYGQVNADRYFTLGTAAGESDILQCGTEGGVYSVEIGEDYINKDIYLGASSDLYLGGLAFAFAASGDEPAGDFGDATIEGEWNVTTDWHYAGGSSLGQQTDVYTATLDGNVVTFTNQFGEKFIAEFTAENTLTFKVAAVGNPATFTMTQNPFVDGTKVTDTGIDPENFVFESFNATYDPEKGTITFPEGVGLAFGPANAAGVFSYYQDAFDFVSATKVGGEEPTPEVITHRWDFTKWSDATYANLLADAAESYTEGWSDIEKNGDTEPTATSKDNCFWSINTPDEIGGLSANKVLIDELKGLKFGANVNNRGLAIAVNYPVALSTYEGPSYLWLGGANKQFFTIPAVKAGSTIKMGVESHKTTDARGVDLLVNGTSIGKFTPTTYAENTWTVTADGAVNVVVDNTNGCHIYFIEVEQDQEALMAITKADLQTVIEAVNAIEDFSIYTEESVAVLGEALAAASNVAANATIDEIAEATYALLNAKAALELTEVPEPTIMAYTVNEVAGDIVFRTTEGEALEGTAVKVPYRLYNADENGKLYKKGATSKEYNYSFTLTAEGQVENIEYAATEVENVVFIAEGEDIEGLTPITTGNAAIRSSNSAAGHAAEDTEIVTLEAGIYNVHVVMYDASKGGGEKFTFKTGEQTDSLTAGENISEGEFEVTVTKDTPIILAANTASNKGLDAIYVVKTGDVDPTGIEAVCTEAKNGNVYNLQGQKVEKAQKGLYIVNGKKVVVK